MKLTKIDREAFVRAVMDDVPMEDYEKAAQQALRAAAIAALPPAVQVVAKEHPDLLKLAYLSMPVGVGNFYAAAPRAWEGVGWKTHASAEVVLQVAQLATKSKEQGEARSAMRGKLQSAIDACSTLKSAKAALPEFEKYLPAERDPAGLKNAPMVANLVDDLNALGWPKEDTK